MADFNVYLIKISHFILKVLKVEGNIFILAEDELAGGRVAAPAAVTLLRNFGPKRFEIFRSEKQVTLVRNFFEGFRRCFHALLGHFMTSQEEFSSVGRISEPISALIESFRRLSEAFRRYVQRCWKVIKITLFPQIFGKLYDVI